MTCRHIRPSFYYWKTSFNLSQRENDLLHSLNVNILYIRFFDVEWDNSANKPQPVGTINFTDDSSFYGQIVPVVYIVNKVFVNIKHDQIGNLAGNIQTLIGSILQKNRLNVREIQIDCDWTVRTRQNYFDFLDSLKSKLNPENYSLSATIRLHQVKYTKITGIPPVKRGMLMFYNMGKLDLQTGRNSIYNKKDADRYSGYIKHYPLRLDVALPVFSWAIHSRKGRILGLLNNYDEQMLSDISGIRHVGGEYYKADTAFFYHGDYFMSGDIIKLETVTPGLALEAAEDLAHNIRSSAITVALFRFDSLTIQHYEKKDFEKIFDCFR